MRLGRRQVVDADVRIYVQEVRAVHTAASDGGMRAAVRLPGMRRASPPCPPDRTRLPHHVGRRAPGRRKVRAHHRRIARAGKIARSRMQLLCRPGFQDGETCQGESASASLTDLASRDPANFPQVDPIFSRHAVDSREQSRRVPGASDREIATLAELPALVEEAWERATSRLPRPAAARFLMCRPSHLAANQHRKYRSPEPRSNSRAASTARWRRSMTFSLDEPGRRFHAAP
jgi:hypothetical protein